MVRHLTYIILLVKRNITCAYQILERLCSQCRESIDTCEEPSTSEEAMGYEDSSRWMISMQGEIKSLHKNNTWDLVELPKEKKVVRCKWVFKKKGGIP